MRPSPSGLLDYREFPILYVDDEPENLRIFELAFQRDFSILTARSGPEGLGLLNREPVALVLSDHRMPGMTGVDFLTRACELDPKTVRILVTAYGDAETLQAAVNSGSIYRFVPKPWSPEDLRVTLRRAIEVYALERERSQLLRELSLLNRVSRSINQELALEPLLDLLLETVTDDFGYDAAGLMFFDAEGRNLSWSRLRPDDGEVGDQLRRLSIGEHGAPAFVRRLRDAEAQLLGIDEALGLEGPVRRWVTEVAAEEILVLPLAGRARVIGALAVDNRRGGRRFSSDDRTLLEGLATQAVIAIQNARLVEDLRRSREQILRADRLGTLGTLAAGLAHEINNPLVSIHTFLSMAPVKRGQDDPEFWGDYHQLASREVDRIRRLVDTMRRLGRDDRGGEPEPPRRPVDVGELVQEVVTLLQREAARTGVAIQVDREPAVPPVSAVRDQLHQMLLNLGLNAIHASSPGGQVRIHAGPDPTGSSVLIEVSDDGPGIPEAHLHRVFDPFFTTKGPKQGTGLGLMICHQVVSDHGGAIEVQSREGEGASFRVRLPRAADSGAGAGDPAA